MTDERFVPRRFDWTIGPPLTQLEQLEAACKQVVLHAEEGEARTALMDLLDDVVASGLNPFSPGESVVQVAARQICVLAAILVGEKPDPLALRVAAESLSRTLNALHDPPGHRERPIG